MAITTDTTVLGQAAHADTVYMTGATGLDVQDDLDARQTLYATPVSAVAGADYPGDLPYTSVAVEGVVTAKVYDQSQAIYVASGNPTAFESSVASAIASGYVWDTGTAYDSLGNLTPYVDPMVLIQASILTGVKAF
jgi:hypothetical protein